MCALQPPATVQVAFVPCCFVQRLQTGVRSIGEAVGRLLAAHGRVPLLDPMVDLKVGSGSVFLAFRHGLVLAPCVVGRHRRWTLRWATPRVVSFGWIQIWKHEEGWCVTALIVLTFYMCSNNL